MTFLTQDQLVDLALKSYITIEDKRLYFKNKYDSIEKAQDDREPKDHIFFSDNFCFILSPEYQQKEVFDTINQ
jgi:hypothetical protein